MWVDGLRRWWKEAAEDPEVKHRGDRNCHMRERERFSGQSERERALRFVFLVNSLFAPFRPFPFFFSPIFTKYKWTHILKKSVAQSYAGSNTNDQGEEFVARELTSVAAEAAARAREDADPVAVRAREMARERDMDRRIAALVTAGAEFLKVVFIFLF